MKIREIPPMEWFGFFGARYACWMLAPCSLRQTALPLGNQTPQQARQALEEFEGFAPGALASDESPEYQNPAASRFE